VQCHEREGQALTLGDETIGDLAPSATELHHDTRGPGVGETHGERAQIVRLPGQRNTSREHQVTRAEQRADVDELGGVHPPDRTAERPVAGEHLRLGIARNRHVEEVAQGQDSLDHSAGTTDITNPTE
jgi:hypothetical protein